MATRTISTKLAVEGESEYKSAISACNTQLSTLKSSLALVESQFTGNANSMEALTAKGTALSSMYDAQKEKVTTLESALKNAQTAQEAYAQRVATAQSNIEQYEAALDELKNSTGDTSEEQELLTKELEKWNAELVEAQGYQEGAERGVQNWQKQLNYANVDLNNLSTELDQNNRYLAEAEASADGCATSIDKFGKSAEDSADQSKEAFTDLATVLVASGVIAAIKSVEEALMDCANAAATFETAMAKVGTIADTSVVSLTEIQAQIVSLSNETGIATTNIAEATYSAISAGVDTASAVEFVAAASQLAAGGFTETETAVDVLTTALNAYGLSVSEVSRVSDVLINTQNLGKTTVDELSSSVGTVIPLASAYGVEIENLGAAYATLTANGVETQTAGTYLKNMLSELGDSGSTVATILQEQTGQSFSSLMASGYSLGDVLEILGDSVGGSATAFSELWSSTQAGVGALSIFNSGAESFNSTLASMEACAGSTTTAYDTMASTTEYSQQRMTTAMENLQIAIGTQLNPALAELYESGGDAFTWATDFVNENPWLVAAMTATTTGLAVLAVGVTGVTMATKLATAAQTAYNAVLAANPVGLVVVAVAGLVAVLATLTSIMGSAVEDTSAYTKSLEEAKIAHDELTESIKAEAEAVEVLAETLQSALEVESKSEAQKAAILELVSQLNEAVPGLGLAYDTVTDSINMTTVALDNLITASAAQTEYEAQVARLSELYVAQTEISTKLEEAQTAFNEAAEQGDWNTAVLARSIGELSTAYEETTAEIVDLESATAEYGVWQAASQTATTQMTATVTDLITEMEALQITYNDAYNAAMESIEGQLGLFEELDGSAQTSVESLIETLKGQVDYMNVYAENINKAMELGVDQGLVQTLSDGSEESAQILAAIVAGGQEDIQALNEQLAKVEEGKQVFSSTVAEMETDFSAKMTSLEARIAETVTELDVSIEASAAGVATIQGYIDGAESMKSQLVATYTALAQAANAAYKATLNIQSPSKVFYEDGQNSIQGAIDGGEAQRENLENTYASLALSAAEAYERALPIATEEPNTANLQGEQTAAILRAVSEKQGSGDTNIYITSPEALTEKSAAREFKKAARDLSLGVT